MTEPADPQTGDGGLVRLRLDLGYDGTAFSGWARQPGRRTVEEVLGVGLATVLRVPEVRLVCAGRTDAGVHAGGQVAHADVPVAAYAQVAASLGDRMAGVLPSDVRMFTVAPAPAGFHARFSPLWRRYAYRVCDERHGVAPLRRFDVLWHRRPLDLEAMDQAAEALLGEHDFAAFCRRREGATTVRTLIELSWCRDENGFAVATVRADAFCHSMVRSLVGSTLAVGDGREVRGWPARLLAAGTRDPAVQVAAARGLSLEEVRYPDTGRLAARAELTRRRRGEGPR